MNTVLRWIACGVFVALFVSHPAIAQDKSGRDTARMDVFLGFSASHDRPPNALAPDSGGLTPGWLYGFDGGFATSLTRSLDLVLDVGMLGADRNLLPGTGGDSAGVRHFASTTFLLAGPQFTMRRHRLLQPFVRCLIGGSFQHVTPYKRDAGFAAGLGGGLDLALSPRWALRMIQYDFLAHTNPSGWSGYDRVSFGLVIRFRAGGESDNGGAR